MATIVVMPGGFHPFHAGHLALYNSARRAFPDADVYVAATNDTSTRPFPFAVKEKLARLAGVEPGHFVQVKSPFQAKEITDRFNPETDHLIFVRSEKDAQKPPQAGGVKKDGSPSYLQPLLGAKRLDTFNKHAYMAYLPTVEFGPGMTSATEIRAAWPQLNDQRKDALVMSLYPRTQGNPKLAATVRKMLDTAIVSEEVMSPIAENQGWAATLETKKKADVSRDPELYRSKLQAKQHYSKFSGDPEEAFDKWVQRSLMHSEEEDAKHNKILKNLQQQIQQLKQQISQKSVMEYSPEGLHATYQDPVVQPDYIEEKWSEKYKRSINCNNPKGFSQRAHCQGRKKK